MHLLHLTIKINHRLSPWKLGCPITLENPLSVTLEFSFFLWHLEVTMINTLGTSTPTNPELEELNVPEVDALGVALVDLPNEVQVVIG
jgi:hypothetical protein